MSIAARWAGWCHECGGRWQLGDQIERGRSHGYAGWTHAVCPDAADPLPDVRPGEVACPACWLIHPAGACDL